MAVAAVAATCALAALVTAGLREDYRLQAFVATSDESYDTFQAFTEEFTSNEFALVAVHTEGEFGPDVEAIVVELAAKLRALPAVQRCSSLTDIPVQLRRLLGDQLESHPLLAGNLISADRKTVAILCQMSGEAAGGSTRRGTVAQLKQIVAAARSLHPEHEIILTGPYVTLIDMYAYVDRDLLVFSMLAFVLMVLTLWAVFRRLPPMLFAAAVALCSLMCTLGLTVALGVVTSLITQMIVILVIVLSVANCVHLAIAARESCLAGPETTVEKRAAATLSRMLKPCTGAMVTTAVGFGSVCVSEIAPVRRFGALMVFGLLASLVISLAAVVPLHRGRTEMGGGGGKLAGLLEVLGRVTARRPTVYIAVFVVLIGVLATGVWRLNIESDFVKNFRPGSEVRRSYRFIERNLSPLGSVEVVVRHRDGKSVATAEAVSKARALGEQVVGRFAMVKKSLTVADALSLVLPGELADDAAVAVRIALLKQWPDGAQILRSFLNEQGDAMRINFRCIEGFDVNEKLRACTAIEKLAADRFGDDYEVTVTGLYHFYAKLVSGLLRDQYQALGLTTGLIAVAIWVVLRSLRLTVIAMIVNLAPVLACLGAMGWADVPVNMTTAMMLSVTLGIAVDDALHYLCSLRRELGGGARLTEAIVSAHRGVGQACVFTTVVIVGGFSILMLSQFLPTAYFGGLVGFTMGVALAADLVVLPALVVLLDPRGVHTRGAGGEVRPGP